jgi:ATP-dependent helicase HrpA
VVSARHFDGWWKKQRHRTPDLLTFTRDDLLRVQDDTVERPDHWQAGDLSLPLTYRFEPGAVDDGVTVHIPVEVLARLGGDEFGWQVPALREELVTALIRSFPRPIPPVRCSPTSRRAESRYWRRCSANYTGAPVFWYRSRRSIWTSCPPICG